MEGFKLIKTTFENKKEIVGVKFNGDESYYLFVDEVRKVYNLPKGSEIQVYSGDFIVKPNIFLNFVAQYISNLDFVLDIKVASTVKRCRTATTSNDAPQIPSTLEIQKIPEIQQVANLRAMENKHRTRIAKAVIGSILTNNPDKRLLREEFIQLAESIVKIFPAEVKETYYVPFSKGHLARGKLYDAYNNTRARLSASGVIRRRIKFKSHSLVVADDSSILSDSEVDENQLEILKSGCDDWDLVLELWRKSHCFRQNEFKNENLEAMEYIDKYKVLQNEYNYQLFEIDYKMLYPTSKSIYEWKLYYHKIIDKAEKLKDNFVREILNCIANIWEEDSKLAMSLLLVPYLLPTSRQRTKLEVQESFICYSQNIVKEEDDDEENDCVKRIKFDNQPKVYLVADCTNTICFAYLDMYGRRHRFHNPLQAIEVCFHCLIAMNIKYPKFCEHVWLFMQKLIFQINTPHDAIIPSINTLINDLQLQ